MFSYTSLIKEIDNFNSDSFMKSEIADVWKRKNSRVEMEVGSWKFLNRLLF